MRARVSLIALADGDGVGAQQAGQDLLRADLTQVDDGDEGAAGVCQQGFAMGPGRFQAPSAPLLELALLGLRGLRGSQQLA
jgi:hypothetical protein